MGLIATAVGAIAGAIGSAATAIGSFISGLGIFGKVALWGLNAAVSALMRPKTPEQQTGVKFDLERGGDVPRQVPIGLVGLAGQDCYIQTYNKSNKSAQQVFQLGDYPIDGVQRVGLNGEWVTLGGTDHEDYNEDFGFPVTSGDCEGHVWFKFYDGRQTAADANMVENAGESARWTANHIGVGCAYAIMSCVFDKKEFTQYPTPFFEVRGARLYDWRKDSTVAGGSGPQRWNNPATHAYSENPIVADYHYRRGFAVNGDVFCGMEMPATDLPLDKYTLAANVCDETATDGQKRYRVSLLINCMAQHGENIEALMLACGGLVIDGVEGSWPIVGTNQPIVATITDDDLIVGAPLSFQAKRSMGTLVNSVGGSYPSPKNLWAMQGYKTQTSDVALGLDRRTRDVPMDFRTVRHNRQAENLAKIYLLENRFEKSASIIVRPRLRGLEPGDWITWQSARFGTAKFMVTEASIASLDGSGPRNVSLSLQERDGAIYSADDIDDILEPIPPPKPVRLSNIAVNLLEGVKLNGPAGREIPSIHIRWDAIEDETVDEVAIRYRPIGDNSKVQIERVPSDNVEVFITRGLTGDTAFEACWRIETVPPRKTEWSAWQAVATPDTRVVNADLGEFSVSNGKFQNLSVTTGKLVDGLITFDKLGDASVGESKIGDGSVKQAKLGDGAVTNPKLAGGSVGTSKVALAAITAALLGLGAVTGPALADGAVGAAKLAPGSVVASKILDGAIDVAKFAQTIRPVELFDTAGALPTTGNTEGRQGFFGGKLYRYTSGAWVGSTAASDISGTLGSSQIAAGAVGLLQIGDGAITAIKIADAAVGLAKLASGIRPVELFTTALPTTGNTEGRQGFFSGKTYRYTGGAWTASVETVDLSGQIVGSQITDAAITQLKLADLSVLASKLADGSVTNAKLGALAVQAGNLAASAVTADKLADASLTLSKFPTGVRPVETVSSLPATGNVEGRSVVLSTDGKPYRYTGGSWETTRAVDITGQLTNAQIADVAAAKVSGQISGAQIAAAAITNVKVATDAIAAANIQALAITTAKVSANAITAGLLAASSVGSAALADAAVQSAKIADGAVTYGKVAADSITAKHLVVADNSNAITNPYFNLNGVASLDGWNSIGVYTSAQDVPSDGTFRFRVISYDRGQPISDRIYCTAGETYRVEAWVWNTNTEAARLYGYLWTGSDAIVDGIPAFIISGGTDITNVKNAWTQVSYQFTAPAGAAYFTLHPFVDKVQGSNLDKAILWTGFKVRRASSAEMIVDGAIIAAKVSAGAIVSGKIAAGTIQTADLAAGIITTGKLAAGSVTTTELGAGAVTAAKVQAGTITASEIAGATITGAKVAAGTITGGNVAAATISTGNLSADSVTASIIAANSITSADLQAGSVTAGAIATNAISSDKILAGAITAGKVAAGAIGATEISATAIRATHLAIGSFDNLVPDGDYQDATWWYAGGGANPGVYGAASNAGDFQRRWLRVPQGTFDIYSSLFPVEAGATYRIRARIYAPPGFSGNFYPLIHMPNLQYFSLKHGTSVSPTTDDATNAVKASGDTGVVTWTYTYPADAVAKNWQFRLKGSYTSSGDQAVVQVEIVRVADATLIVDGAVIASKILAGAVTSAKLTIASVQNANLANGAVTTVTISDGAISAGKLGVGAVTAEKIDAGAVTAEKILAGAVGTNKLAVGIGGNLVGYSDFLGTIRHVVAGDNNTGLPLNVAQETATWKPSGMASVGVTVTGTPAAGSTFTANLTALRFDGALPRFPVTAGDRYELSAYFSSHRCTSQMYVAWHDSSGAIVSYGGGATGQLNAQYSINNPLSEWEAGRIKAFVTAPPGATTATILLRGIAPGGHADPYIFATGVFFAPATPNQTEFRPWSNGGTSVIDGGSIIAGSIVAGNIATDAITSIKVVASSITGSKLAPLSVSASHINADSITAGMVQAGSIGATHVAAGAIVASKLAITNFFSVIPDGEMQDISFWNGAVGGGYYAPAYFQTIAASGAAQNGRTIALNRGVRLPQGTFDIYTPSISIDAGVAGGGTANPTYRIRARIFTPSGFTGYVQPVLYMPGVQWFALANGQSVNPATHDAANGAITAAGNVWREWTFTNTSALKSLQVRLYGSWSGNAGDPAYVAVEITKMSDGSLIVDGVIQANHIQANAIGANQIAADAITAKHLLLADNTNAITNPYFNLNGVASLEGWNSIASTTIAQDSPGDGSFRFRAASGNRNVFISDRIYCSAGETFYVECYVLNTNTEIARLYGYVWDGNGGIINGIPPFILSGGTDITNVKNTWTKISYQFTAPAGAAYFNLYPFIDKTEGANPSVISYWSGFKVRRANNAELIVDGAITTNKITAGAVKADQVDAGSITSGKIAAGAVGASQIAAGAIVVSKLAVTNFQSVITDGAMSDINWWSGATWANTTTGYGVSFQDISTTGTSNAGNTFTFYRGLRIPNGSFDIYTPFFPITLNRAYRVRARVYTGGMTGGYFQPMIHMPGVQFFSLKHGAAVNPGVQNAANAIVAAGDGFYEWVIPSAAAASSAWQLRFLGNTTGSDSPFVQVEITPMNDGALIVDGAITANKIAARTIIADRLVVGTITTLEVGANQITAFVDGTGTDYSVTDYKNSVGTGYNASDPFTWSYNFGVSASYTAVTAGRVSLTLTFQARCAAGTTTLLHWAVLRIVGSGSGVAFAYVGDNSEVTDKWRTFSVYIYDASASIGSNGWGLLTTRDSSAAPAIAIRGQRMTLTEYKR